MVEAADIRAWRGHAVDPTVTRSGNWRPSTSTRAQTSRVRHHQGRDAGAAPACVRTRCPGDRRSRKPQGRLRQEQVNDSPSISTEGELPATDEEAIFKLYSLPYRAGTSGERQLARR